MAPCRDASILFGDGAIRVIYREGEMTWRSMRVVRNAACFGIGVFAAMAAPDAFVGKRLRGFRGKVVVITGASRGLGLALAEVLARRGAKLALVARDEFELDRARRKLLENGAAKGDAELFAIVADLRNRDQAEGMIAKATSQFGRVDVLINNAGVITVGPLENQTVEDFREVMEANFFSGVYSTLAVLPQMLARGEGAIANITSIGGKVAVPHMLPYTASKFAAVGFSEGLATELRTKGVRVTTVVPGLMRTGSHLNAQFKGDAEREYRWFSLAASLPGVSIAAHRAARQIANGIESGCEEVTVTPQAFLISRLANVSPEVTRALMRGMNALLPKAEAGNNETRRGEEVKQQELFPLTAFGTRAAREYNQAETVGEKAAISF
jgi:short-subunit dehydrogenase